MNRTMALATLITPIRPGVYFLAAGLSLIALCSEVWSHELKLKGEPAQRQELNVPIEDFTLTDQDGRAVAFSELRGKPLVINFMYTSCPDVCPLLTASLKILRQKMNPPEAASIRFLSITTDPEIDRPEILKAYSERHEADVPNWSWLTGSPEDLAAVWQDFGVAVKRKGRGLIDHTTLTVIADARGLMRFAYFGSFPDPDVLLQDLRAVAKESSD
jgi:protein SCO1/2